MRQPHNLPLNPHKLQENPQPRIIIGVHLRHAEAGLLEPPTMISLEFMTSYMEFSFGIYRVSFISRLFLTLVLRERRKHIVPLFGRTKHIWKKTKVNYCRSQAKWSNFHVGSLVTKRTRTQDGLPYEGTRSYGLSYEVPRTPSHLQKTLT